MACPESAHANRRCRHYNETSCYCEPRHESHDRHALNDCHEYHRHNHALQSVRLSQKSDLHESHGHSRHVQLCRVLPPHHLHLQEERTEERGHGSLLRTMPHLDIHLPFLHRIYEGDSGGIRGRFAYGYGTDTQHPSHPPGRLEHRLQLQEKSAPRKIKKDYRRKAKA